MRHLRTLVAGILILGAVAAAAFAFVRAGELAQGAVGLLVGLSVVLATVGATVAAPHRAATIVPAASLLASLATLVALAMALAPEPEVRIVGPPTCEAIDRTGRQFIAVAEDVQLAAITEANEGRGIVYRAEAQVASDADVLGRLLPDNCLAGFDGFCIGQPLTESGVPVDIFGPDTGPPESQWLSLRGVRGYVSAAVVQELAPGTAGLSPEQCPGAPPVPNHVDFTQAPPTTITEPVRIEADAPNARIVAAAVFRRPGTDEGASWQPIDFDFQAENGFQIDWDPTGEVAQRGATLLVTVCWSANVPAHEIDVTRQVDLFPDAVPPGAPDAPPPDDRELQEGRAVACAYSAPGGQ